jgi:hypothetical protein
MAETVLQREKRHYLFIRQNGFESERVDGPDSL